MVELIENVAHALCENVADDVHLSHRFGEVLAFCCKNFRTTRDRDRATAGSHSEEPEETANTPVSTGEVSAAMGPESMPPGHDNDLTSHTPTYAPDLRNPLVMPYGPHLPPPVYPSGLETSTGTGIPGGSSSLPQVTPNGGNDTGTSATLNDNNTAFMSSMLTPSATVFGATTVNQPLRQEALMNFATMGGNQQLGWAGGQDMFDMLGPFMDNLSYEALHR